MVITMLKEIKNKIIQFINVLNILMLYISKILNGIFRLDVTKNGNPMTNIKLVLTILAPFIIMVFVGLVAYQMYHQTHIPPAPYNPINNTSNVQYVRYVYAKNANIATPYPTEAPHITPNPTVIVTSNPTVIVTSNPVVTSYPLPTPKPTYTVNEQYISEHNYLHVNGLNTDYKVKQGEVFKRGKPITLNFMVQNLYPEKLNSLTGTLTISAWAIDNKLLQPYLSDVRQTIIDEDNLNLREYDTYQIKQTVTIPSNTPTGSYLIIMNINGDNQARLEMQQIIQVI
jgi:hypothetical protein